MSSFLKTIFLLFTTITLSFAQSYTDKNNNAHLWGPIALEELSAQPYSEWYETNYNEYQPTLNIEHIASYEHISVKAFIGTWCGDTKHLFPRFTKYWSKMGLTEDQLEIIALHNDSEVYKQGPNGETIGYNIHRVPTFIFYRDNVEAGRIVERTVFDIGTDVNLIVTGSPYKNRYMAVTALSSLIEEHPDSLQSESFLEFALDKIKREVASIGELNTWGYVLFFMGDLEKSEFVFKLNQELYPYSPITNYGMGRILNKKGEYENAKEAFQEAIRIRPNFDRAVMMLHECNEAIQDLEN